MNYSQFLPENPGIRAVLHHSPYSDYAARDIHTRPEWYRGPLIPACVPPHDAKLAFKLVPVLEP
jgi:hypothetical protein